MDRQQLEEELGDGHNIATVGDDGEPLMVAMLAIPWDARPGDELKVPPPLEQFTEIGGYPAAKDGYTFVVPPGTRGGDLAKLPVATPEEAGQVVFQRFPAILCVFFPPDPVVDKLPQAVVLSNGIL